MLPQETHHPIRSNIHTHGTWYKYFILITIVPHQNYSSTKHNNTKNRFPSSKPYVLVPAGKLPGLRAGVFLRAAALLTSAFLKSLEGAGRGWGVGGGAGGCRFCTHPSLLSLGLSAAAALHPLSSNCIAEPQLRILLLHTRAGLFPGLPLHREARGRSRRGRGCGPRRPTSMWQGMVPLTFLLPV